MIDSGFGIMFTIVPLMVAAVFIFVFGMIIFRGVRYAKDKTLPVVPVHTKIISKRTHVWGEHSHTDYYATFELENGERMELAVPENKIGYLAEGDSGILSFQGNLYVDFKRT